MKKAALVLLMFSLLIAFISDASATEELSCVLKSLAENDKIVAHEIIPLPNLNNENNSPKEIISPDLPNKDISSQYVSIYISQSQYEKSICVSVECIKDDILLDPGENSSVSVCGLKNYFELTFYVMGYGDLYLNCMPN